MTIPTVQLRRIARIEAGQSPPSGAVTALVSGQPFIQGNAEFGPVHPLPRLQADLAPKTCKAGDLLLSVRAPVGALNWADQPYGIGRGLAAIRPKSADPRFLAYALKSSVDRLISRAAGSTFTAVTSEDLGSCGLPWTHVDEDQQRIADFLDYQVRLLDQTGRATRLRSQLVSERCVSILRSELLGGGRLIGGFPWFESLPQDWRRAPLMRGWRVIDCKHRTPDYLVSGVPVISPGDVTPGRLDLDVATRFVGEDDYIDLADRLRRCRRGDIVYGRNASVGIASYVDTAAPFTLGQDVCRITSTTNDQLFLTYVLNHVVGPQIENSRIGSTFTRINIEQIKHLKVPSPEVSAQRAIARRCDRIAARQRDVAGAGAQALKLLEERKGALITACVTGEFDVRTASTRAADAALAGLPHPG